jgi:hypothetical protein
VLLTEPGVAFKARYPSSSSKRKVKVTAFHPKDLFPQLDVPDYVWSDESKYRGRDRRRYVKDESVLCKREWYAPSRGTTPASRSSCCSLSLAVSVSGFLRALDGEMVILCVRY